MRHQDRVLELKALYEDLLKKLAAHDPGKLPNKVDIKKLEKAYEELKDYVFVLKKVSKR